MIKRNEAFELLKKYNKDQNWKYHSYEESVEVII